MRISAEWINHVLERPLPVQQLAEAMEAAGIEVDAVEAAPDYDPKIVTGRVLEATPHPDADRLKLAKVDVGGTTLEIVCGAPNLAAGQVVPVATVGAVLPDGTVITKAKLRGVASNGMICSERELGLSDNHAGIMVLPPDTVIGTPVKKVITKSDVIDATTSANRWDLTSIVGIAREVAAQTDQNLAQAYPEHLTSSGRPGVQARVDDPALAPRYMVARLKIDKSKATPQWMAERLLASGVRPISLVVDITNYILLEYGQPLHAFDANKIDGEMIVRAAYANEELITLDGQTRKLSPEDVVIADTKKPLALAGVMGGQNSEINEHTTEIILESAVFNPALVRKTAVRHGLRSDASARFERRVPLNCPPRALGGAALGQGAIGLLEELADAELVGDVLDIIYEQPVYRQVNASVAAINSVLGLELTATEITTYLERLSFGVQSSDQPHELLVDVPWWRQDVATTEDLAEEVIKLVGYEQLPATLPTWSPTQMQFDHTWSDRWRAKQALLSCGLFEVVTYSFISKNQVQETGQQPSDLLKLQNPLSSEQAYLRDKLLPSLLTVAHRNRTYADRFGMFELSKVYIKQGEGELPQEPHKLAALVVAPHDGYRAIKGVLDHLNQLLHVTVEIRPERFDTTVAHPTQSAVILCNGEQIGIIARLHPQLVAKQKIRGEVGYMELDWDRYRQAIAVPVARDLSRYPVIARDISVEVEREVTWSDIQSTLGVQYTPRFMSDYYGTDLPDGKKVMTVRITIRRDDRTPTDEEANQAEAAVQQRLRKAIDAKIR